MVKALLSRLFAALPRVAAAGLIGLALSCSNGAPTAPAQGADFTMDLAQDHLTVAQGGAGSDGVNVAWICACTPSDISFSMDGLPAGMTATFAANPSGDVSTLVVNADTSVKPGTYAVLVKGVATQNGGSLLHTAKLSILVPDPVVPDFTLNVENAALSIPVGSTATADILVERLGGFSSALAYTVSGLPSGSQGSITNGPLTPALAGGDATVPQNESRGLLLDIASTTAPGTYHLVIEGNGGGIDHTVLLTLVLTPNADFALSPNPSSLSVTRGFSGTPNPGPVALNIARANGFTDIVQLSLVAPAGISGSFTPSSTSATASTLNLTLDPALPAGNYTVDVHGTNPSATLSRDAKLVLTVNPAGPDFQVSVPANEPITMSGGAGPDSLNVPVSFNVIGGFASNLSLSVAGLPAGVTGSFAPNPASAAGGSTLALSVPQSLLTGSYPNITVTATGGGLTRTATFTLVVTNAGTFTLQAAPGTVTIPVGPLAGNYTGTSTVTIVPANGFNASVNLSASGLPAGVTAAFAPNPTTNTSALTFTAAYPAAALGTHTITLNGSGGGRLGSTTLTLDLVAGPDFSLGLGSGALAVVAGKNNQDNVTVTALHGFTGNVALALTDAAGGALPAGFSASFAPASGSGGFGSVLTLSAAASVAPGSYSFKVQGQSGGILHTAALAVTVSGFTLGAAPSPVIVVLPAAGSATGTSTVTVNRLFGFADAVNLSAAGPPAGVSAAFAPNPAVGASSTLTLTVASTTAPGSYTLTVTGTDGSLSAQTTLDLEVPSFTVGLSQAALNIPAGQSATDGITITGAFGFSGSATLSLVSPPAGITASFAPNPASTAGSTLTLSVASTVAAGNYPLTLRGVSGGVSSQAALNLTVSDFTLGAAPSGLTIIRPTTPASPVNTGGSTLSLTALSGFNDLVNLSATGLPAGVTAAFAPASTRSSSALTLSVDGTAAPGVYPITITAKDVAGAPSHSTTVTLTIPTPDFSLGLGSAALAVVRGGVSATDTANVMPINGFGASVNLSLAAGASAVPAGMTASFATNPATTGSAFTIATTTATPAGVYNLLVSGTSGGSTRTTPIAVTVQDFAIGAAPSTFTIDVGRSSTSTVTVAALQGFTDAVTLSSSGQPGGVTVAFSANPQGPGTCTATFNVAATTVPGTYTIVLKGTDPNGVLFRTSTLHLTVPAPDFSLSLAAPALSVVAGSSSASDTVTVNSINNFTGAATLSLVAGTSAVPAGMTASFATNPATASSTFTIATTAATPSGIYNLAVQGVNGALTHTVAITVTVQDFTLSVAPSPISVLLPALPTSPANVGTSTVTIGAVQGFTDNVTLSATGAPTGVSVAFAPNPKGPGTSTATVTVTNAAAAGSYPLTIKGTDPNGVLSHTATLTLNIPVQDFSLSLASSAASVVAGSSSAADTVTVNSINGFAGKPVTLSLVAGTSAVPAGMTASFATNPATSTSTFTIGTTAATPSGVYNLAVQGVNGALVHTAAIAVTVQDFTLSVAPSPISVLLPPLPTSPANTGTSTVTIGAVQGFGDNVTLSATGAPTGVSVAFAPNPQGPGASTATVTVTNAATAGSYPLTIKGTDPNGVLSHTATLTLNVPTQDFSLSLASNASTVVAGSSSAADTVTINSINGFAGKPVTLSLVAGTSAVPAGMTASFATNPATTTSTFTLATTAATPSGIYNLNVQGVNGVLVHTAAITVTVQDFTLSVAPSPISILLPPLPTSPANTGTSTVTIGAVQGFSDAVNLGTSGTLPAGVSVAFAPNPQGPGSSTATVSVTNAAAAGSYPLTIKGTDPNGVLVHTATLTLNIPAPDFSLSLASAASTLVAGGSSATDTVTVNSINGFAGKPVTLSLAAGTSAVPAGMTATFATNPATASSTFTLATTAATPSGVYTLAIQGVNGALTHTATITVTVQDFTLSVAPSPISVLLPPLPASPANTGTSTVTIGAVQGFSDAVTLGTSGTLPTGVSVAFAPNPQAPGASTAKVSVTNAAAAGSYTLVLTGTDPNGVLVHTANLVLNIPAPDFSLSLASAATSVVAGSTSAADTVTVNSINGFAGRPVTLSLADGTSTVPAGMTATFATNPATATSTFTLATTAATPSGIYNLNVQGVNGALTHTTAITVTVQDFTLSVAPTPISILLPPLPASPANTGTSTVTIGAVQGFADNVTLSATGAPTGVSVAFAPNPQGPGSSTATVSVTNAATAGSYPLTIKGTDSNGVLSHTATLTLNIPAPDFSLSLASNATSVVAGSSSAADTVTINSINGFAGRPVTLSLVAGASAVPAGMTASFATNPATTTSSFSIATTAATPSGVYTLAVQGVNGALTHTAAITVTVQDFTLSVAPTPISVLLPPLPTSPANTGTSTVTIGAVQGFTDSVTLTATGAPTGVSVAFAPNPQGPGTSTATVSVTNAAASGSYPLTIKGTDPNGVLSHTATLTLTIPGPDFSLSLASAATSIVAGSSSASDTVTINSINGFSGRPVTLSLVAGASAVPAGMTASFATNPATTSSTFSIATTAATPAGVYTLAIQGVNGALTHTATITVTVQDFSLSVAPTPVSVNLPASGTSTGAATLTITGLNGYSNAVNLGTSGALPTGVGVSYAPNPQGPGTSAVTVSVGTTATPGTYTLTLLGADPNGVLAHTASLVLNILPTPDFSLSAANLTMAAGGSAATTVTATPTNFSSNITLSASGQPAGMTVAFGTNPITSGGYSSSLTVSTTTAVAPGTYTLTITGVGGGLTRTTTITVDVTSFTLSIKTSPLNILNVPGRTVSDSVNVTPVGSFTDAVTFTTSGLPANIGFSYSTNPSTSGSAFTVSIPAGVPVTAGTYTVTITGTSPTGIVQTANFTLNVDDFSLGGPATRNVVNGFQFTNANYTVTDLGGFSGAVNFSVAVSPVDPGISTSLSTASSTTGTTLSFFTNGAVAAQDYTVTITGTDAATGTLTHTFTTTVSVTDFSLSEVSTGFSITIPASGQPAVSQSTTVSLNSFNGYSHLVNLAAAPPTGVTVSFSPASLTGGGTGSVNTTMTITVDSTASPNPAGSPLVVTGTDSVNGLTRTVSRQLSLQPTPDFTLGFASGGSITVVNNSTVAGTNTLNITPVNGFSGSVNFSATGVPSGLSLSFGTNPATTSTTVSVDASIGAAFGDYPVTITGTGGGQTHTIALTIHLVDFTVSTSPATVNILRPFSVVSVPPPNTLTSTLTVAPNNGFNSTVGLSTDALPTGVNVSFSPTSVAGGSGTSTMTFSVQNFAATGRTGFNAYGNITGTGRSTAMALNVMDFSVGTAATGGSVSVPATGQSTVTTTIPYTVTTQDYFGTLNLAAVGLPAGASASFSSTLVPIVGSSMTLSNFTASIPVTMTISIPVGTATGTFNISLQATDQTFNQSRSSGLYTLIVNPAEDFSLTSKPSTITMETTDFVRGNTLTAISTGFAGTVSVSQSGAPSGMTITLGSGGNITMTSGGSGGLAYTVATAGVPAGTYPITFTASGTNSDGAISRSTVVNILVVDYTLTFGTDPVMLLDTASATANTSVNVVSVGPAPFTDTVTIQSVTGAPASSGQTFTGTALDTSTPGSINYFVSGTLAGGTYPITVTATSGNGVTHTFSFTLDVESFTLTPRVVATTSAGVPVHVIIHGAAGGSSGTGTLDAAWLGGYASNISLFGPGGGLYNFAFAPSTLVSTGPTSSTMTVSISPTGSTAGTVTNAATVTGNSPPIGTSVSINLTVEDYSLSGAGVANAGGTGSTSEAVTVTRSPSDLPYDEDVTLTFNDPSGTWSASPVVVNNPGTSGTLVLSSSTAITGTRYSVTVTATTPSGVTHSFNFVIIG